MPATGTRALAAPAACMANWNSMSALPPEAVVRPLSARCPLRAKSGHSSANDAHALAANENGGTMAAVLKLAVNDCCQAAFFLRRRSASAPAMPAPNRDSVSGSGTAVAALVSIVKYVLSNVRPDPMVGSPRHPFRKNA
jgi:hypothetical protein